MQSEFYLKSLKHIQGSDHKENIQKIIPQRNRFGIAFSTAKTAINVALETKSDNELVRLLKDFISSKKIITKIISKIISKRTYLRKITRIFKMITE